MSDDQMAEPGATSAKIHAAAQTLIARHGFAVVSMRQIAGEVGVQVGTLYLHVADKQALLFGLLEAHMQALETGWAEAGRPDNTGQALRNFVEFHLRFHMDRPESSAIARLELRNLTPANAASIDARRRAYVAELEGIITRGVEAGEFSVSDLGLTAAGLIAMLDGAMTGTEADVQASRPRMERICWRLARRLVGG